MNQNWEVKPNGSDLFKDNSFSYFYEEDGFIMAMYSTQKTSISDLEEDWNKTNNPKFKSELFNLSEKEINEIQCLEYKYFYVRPDDKKPFYKTDTYIPCGDGMLTLVVTGSDKEAFKKLESEYNKIINSIKLIS